MQKLPRHMPQTISLESSTLSQTVVQACHQIVRLFFSHIRFVHDADVRIYIEACYDEIEACYDENEASPGFCGGVLLADSPAAGVESPKPDEVTAHWSCTGEPVSYTMEREELAELWRLSLRREQGADQEPLLQIAAKQAALRLLQKVTGQGMPWGILTGVRPGRLWQELAAMNLTLQERRDLLAKRYLVEGTKIDLLQAVAAAQKKVLRDWRGSQSVAVYVSIPFCPSRCSYCTFPGYGAQAAMMEAYLQVLGEEVALLARDIEEFALQINSIYIGGGTPTALEAGQLKRLLRCLTALLPLGQAVEFCCEAGRPDTLTAEKLTILAKGGVNRLCINPQTLNDTTLQRIKRSHSAEDFYRAYELARRLASWRINADMILGLPGEDETHVMKTAEGLRRLALDSVTVHYLSLKRGSEMWLSSYESAAGFAGSAAVSAASWLDGRRLTNVGDGVQRRLMDSGYQPYYMYRQKGMLGNLENVGYSLPGAQSLYNIVMITENQHIAGLGAGAASKIRTGDHSHKNLYHAKDIAAYRKSCREKAATRTELWEKNSG